MGFKRVPHDEVLLPELVPLLRGTTTSLSTNIVSEDTISSHKDICSAIDTICKCAKDLSESGDRVRITIEISKPIKE